MFGSVRCVNCTPFKICQLSTDHYTHFPGWRITTCTSPKSKIWIFKFGSLIPPPKCEKNELNGLKSRIAGLSTPLSGKFPDLIMFLVWKASLITIKLYFISHEHCAKTKIVPSQNISVN